MRTRSKGSNASSASGASGASVMSGWTTSEAPSQTNYEDNTTKCDPILPVVTLSASDKTGQAKPIIPVLGQQTFTGKVLPYAVANTLCRDLSVNEMFEELNVRDCTLGSLRYRAWEYFIAENCDLGTAYAYLRYQPHDIDIGEKVKKAHEYDKKMRRDLLESGEIGEYTPTLRVWDLHANRVVPWWVAGESMWAISHAWVANGNLKYEMTPINGYEWPVPMPKDADLDRIRIEMLNLGAEYIWLDVLCLRQKHRGEDLHGTMQNEWDHREALRLEEWRVDLPIIGWVYYNAYKVACYMSGLGLPLGFKTDQDFEDERCWFNRAWTLQETPHAVVIAGRTCDKNTIDERLMTKEMYTKLKDKLKSVRDIHQLEGRGERIVRFLEEMKKRKSSNPVDKVAGLVYLLQLRSIPLYNAKHHEEKAWTELLDVADGQLCAIFLFLCPKPSGKTSWRPSWHQVMTETFLNLPDISRSLYDDPNVHWTKEHGDWYDGPRMDGCHVQGLANASQNQRHGELKVKDSSGKEHTFGIFADHACPIPDGLYTLLGAPNQKGEMIWVIRDIAEPGEKFRKVSVVRTLRYSSSMSINSFHNFGSYRSTKTYLMVLDASPNCPMAR